MDEQSIHTLQVSKSTGTSADLLVAYGFAQMLRHVTQGDVLIHDQGPAIRLQLKRPLDAEALTGLVGLDLLPWLETKSAPAPSGIRAVNYDREREKEKTLFEARRGRPRHMVQEAPDDQPALPPAPDLDLPLFKLVNQMSALTAYNEVVRRWHADQAHWPVYLRLLLRLFGQHPNDVAAAEAAWKAYVREAGIPGGVRVTAAQILNPAMGKGGDAAKANNATPGNKDSFWLLEYLKLVGAQVSAVPLVVRGAKDRKTYVPVPVHMSLFAHQRVLAQLRERLWANTAVKLDVLAGLAYTRAFLDQWRDGHLTGLASSNPGDFVAGLAVAFYKDMGSALALLNLAQINLPDWMPVSNAADAKQYLDLLAEHVAVVQGLNEDHSDDHHLLQVYRDFLSGHDLEAFYDFAAGYAHVLMRRLAGGQPVRQFTTTNLEVLMMGHTDSEPHLGEIVRNPGFRNLATAIRLSTVVPQRQKARDQKPLYEVRYGLGDELKRKAAYKEQLVQALGEFVHSYCQETTQMLERRGEQRRRLVTDADLDQVLDLIDRYGSKTVGSLLIAYGYARTEYVSTADGAPARDEEPESVHDLGETDDTEFADNE